MGLVLKYVQEPTKARDQYRHRRRVPEELKPYTGKGELIAALGVSKSEALKAYPRIHEGFERELELARKALKADQSKRPFGELSERERYDVLVTRLKEMDVDDPSSADPRLVAIPSSKPLD
jgi:hypothetical protein